MPYVASRWMIQIGVILLVFGASSFPASLQAQQSSKEVQRTNQCDGYMKAYARSSARKLSRALGGQDYQLSKLPARSSLSADSKTFDLVYEGEQRLVGAVERTRHHRTSYVMAVASGGPIITAHRWPTRKQVASGDRECKPIASAILRPEVPVSAIDTEPFKYWGLRVVWHLPGDATSKGGDEPIETLKAAIERTDGEDFDSVDEPSQTQPRDSDPPDLDQDEPDDRDDQP